MDDRTALRLAGQAVAHLDKARRHLQRIIDEHRLGREMREAFIDNQLPIQTNWPGIVRSVLSMAAMIDLAQSKEGD